MILSIITPLTSHQFTVDWVELNTISGNYVIQTGHAPMVVILADNSTYSYLKTNEKQETTHRTTKGIAHITRTNVMLVLDA